MMHWSALISALAVLPWLSSQAAAQRKELTEQPAELDQPVSLTVTGEIGGRDYQISGNGTCRHEPEASLNEASASLWSVDFTGPGEKGLRGLNLTLWRLKSGDPDQLSLVIEAASESYRIETGKGKDEGEGSVTILPNGPGARFEITGKAAKGTPVRIVIDCPRYAGIQAEGG